LGRPDLEHAAELMRRVVDRPGWPRMRGERARETIAAGHSLERTAAFLAERVPLRQRRWEESPDRHTRVPRR
jgi:hypothetical protein